MSEIIKNINVKVAVEKGQELITDASNALLVQFGNLMMLKDKVAENEKVKAVSEKVEDIITNTSNAIVVQMAVLMTTPATIKDYMGQSMKKGVSVLTEKMDIPTRQDIVALTSAMELLSAKIENLE